MTVSKEEAIEALQIVDNRVDGVLSYEKYDEYRGESHPSSATIYSKYGWNNLKKEADLETVQQGQPDVSWPEATDVLLTVSRQAEGELTMEKYEALRAPEDPNAGTLARKFGWSDLKDHIISWDE